MLRQQKGLRESSTNEQLCKDQKEVFNMNCAGQCIGFEVFRFKKYKIGILRWKAGGKWFLRLDLSLGFYVINLFSTSQKERQLAVWCRSSVKSSTIRW